MIDVSNWQEILRNFVLDGIQGELHKKQLKKLGYIDYSHRSWSLSEEGRRMAIKLSLIPGILGIDAASKDGDRSVVVTVEKRGDAFHVTDVKDTDEEESEVSPKDADAYLLWVGADSYPTIEDFVSEAAEMGVSKRMTNATVCKAVVASGLPVLLAHDEGRRRQCDACSGTSECPECRKAQTAIKKLQSELRMLRIGAASDKAKKMIERREASLAELSARKCERCADSGHIKGGTGGHVEFSNGVRWEYRTYNYWLHLPSKISEALKDIGVESLPAPEEPLEGEDWKDTLDRYVCADEMCEVCGGRGELPDGVVFGLFYPTGMELIASSDPKKVVAEEALVASSGATLVTMAELSKEKRRGCGRRKPGGVYVVSKEFKTEATKEKLEEAGAELRGPLISFLDPVSVEWKRCRGVKRVKTTGVLKEELDMIKEAIGK